MVRGLRATTGTLASVLGVTLGLAAGCGGDEDPEGAAELWQKIQAEEYRSWQRAPGFESRRPSNTAHDDEVDIFINDVMVEALTSGESMSEWPEGSIVVKDAFGDGKLTFVNGMEKQAAGWFYAKWTEDGDSKFSGQPDKCVDCHASGSDMVRAFRLP